MNFKDKMKDAHWQILQEVLENGIEVGLTLKGFTVGGFYKSGHVTLTPLDDVSFLGTDRYNGQETICSIKDLILWNMAWWDRSKDKNDFWKQPDGNWGKLMIQHGFAKEEKVTRIVGILN